MSRVGQNHIYIRSIYGFFGGKITKYTVIYGVYIRIWPALCMRASRHDGTDSCSSSVPCVRIDPASASIHCGSTTPSRPQHHNIALQLNCGSTTRSRPQHHNIALQLDCGSTTRSRPQHHNIALQLNCGSTTRS